jgi:hypothetical protein
MTIKPKKSGFGLETCSFSGKKTKNSYIVFKSLEGSYHAFMEVEAKDAIIDCLGVGERKRTTRQLGDLLWKRTKPRRPLEAPS